MAVIYRCDDCKGEFYQAGEVTRLILSQQYVSVIGPGKELGEVMFCKACCGKRGLPPACHERKLTTQEGVSAAIEDLIREIALEVVEDQH